MTWLASTNRIIRSSAFVGLSLVLGVLSTTQQAYTQTNFRDNLPLKFSKEALLNPAVFQQTNQPLLHPEFFVDQAKGKIRLKSKFLGAQKFIFNEQTPQKVYGFWGFNFKPEFEEILSQHPSALQEAKKAYPFNVLSFVGFLGLAAISAKSLINSINDSQEISNGRMVDDRSYTTDLAILGVAGAVIIVSGTLSKNHLQNGVRIFNERQN